MAHGNDVHIRQIARREVELFIHLVGDHEDLVEAHVLHLLGEELGLRRVDYELVDHAQPVLARELRKNRAQAGAVPLAVHLLREVLVGRVREDLAATAPQRARGHAGARAAGALLPPGLLGRVIDRAAILLRAGRQARVRLVGDHQLVHQRLVEFATEDGVRPVDGAATVADHFELHVGALFLRRLRGRLRCGLGGGPRLGLGRRGLRLLHRRLVELRRRTHHHVAPLGAGHRTLHQQKLALGVDAHDRQARDGALLVAEVAGHALAAEDMPRTLVLAGRSGRLVRDRVAVRRALRMEVVAADYAGEALAERHALHVDSLPGLEDYADVELGAGLEVRQLLRLGAEFAQRMARLDARLGEMTGQRLLDARRAALAERHLHGGIAVGLRGLDLGDAVVRHVDHRHGQRRAVLGKDACHADLAADQSDAHTFLFYLGPCASRRDAGCNWPALHLMPRTAFQRRFLPLVTEP